MNKVFVASKYIFQKEALSITTLADTNRKKSLEGTLVINKSSHTHTHI